MLGAGRCSSCFSSATVRVPVAKPDGGVDVVRGGKSGLGQRIADDGDAGRQRLDHSRACSRCAGVLADRDKPRVTSGGDGIPAEPIDRRAVGGSGSSCRCRRDPAYGDAAGGEARCSGRSNVVRGGHRLKASFSFRPAEQRV